MPWWVDLLGSIVAALLLWLALITIACGSGAWRYSGRRLCRRRDRCGDRVAVCGACCRGRAV